ncbi:major facilitator superfamily domain-containing protein [Phycomyces nitens]|nr:major facilitator superfamily domain-containing protein [Phycomyces nitens]
MLQRSNSNSFRGSTFIKGRSTTWKILFLTICLAGLQFTWTVEMAYGTPYLLSLGLSKAYMSLVWIAGPLSGLLMQPIVGVVSDRCTSRWGRRRPFLVGGSVFVITSLLIIGWTKEITSLFTGTDSGDSFKKVSIGVAIFAIYLLDFSVNCVQASCRALLVDSLPPSQQEDGTAWAGRMVGMGNVIGYFMGYADLVSAFPFLGNTQLKVLCVFASLVLIICDGITCYAVKERVLSKDSRKTSRGSPFKAFSDIGKHIWNLPKPIRRICNVQFFAWIGWFPFLFYSTTWVAEIYDQEALKRPENSGDDAVGQATRAGSFAFLVYSLVSLGASFLVPLIVSPSFHEDYTPAPGYKLEFTIRGRKYVLSPSKYLKISFLTLPRAWTISHVIFCIAMLCTVFAKDVVAASVVIGVCGISWSITMWAPFSLLGEYIAQNEARCGRSSVRQSEEQPRVSHPLGVHQNAMSSRISLAAGGAGIGTEGGIYQIVEHFEPENQSSDDSQLEMGEYNHPSTQIYASSRISDAEQNSRPILPENDTDINPSERTLHSPDQSRRDSDTRLDNDSPSAGVLLGIHNMYIVLPQFLVTFFSSIMFHFLEKNSEGEDASPDAIGVVLRFGAIMAGVAAYFSIRVR